MAGIRNRRDGRRTPTPPDRPRRRHLHADMRILFNDLRIDTAA
jgi:hypothetical protein